MYIVEDYIASAEPVSSGQLVEKYEIGVSSATVRNDMASLEQDGYLISPHTSSGRIPTELGYKAYFEFKSDSGKILNASEQKRIEKAYTLACDERNQLKSAARALADVADGAVIVGFDRNDVYYTGISHLFSQPEFCQPHIIYGIGAVVDRLEERISEMFSSVRENVTVRIGSDNPFSDECSFIGFTFVKDRCEHLFGLMGPMRMNYLKNVARLSYVRKLFTN